MGVSVVKKLILADSFYQRNSYQQFSLVKNYMYTGNGNLSDFGILKKKHSAYILQDAENPEIGYRIYKSYKKSDFDSRKDASMIQRLYMNGRDIQDIDFPYGIITKEDRIIGQVIPYYEDGVDMACFPEDAGENLLKAYFLMKELSDHYIYYLDIHEYNFLVTSNGIKLIDFDPGLIGFGSCLAGFNDFYEKTMVMNFITMIHSLLGYRLGMYRVVTMDALYDSLMELLDFDERAKVMIKK